MRRIRALALAAAACLLAASCGTAKDNDGIPEGHALTLRKSYNASMSFAKSLSEASLRGTYAFSCTDLYNASSSPLTYESAKLVHAPSTVKVVGYELLDSAETGGVLLSSDNGKGPGSYALYKDHTSEHPTIPAHKWSYYYPIVKIKLLKMQPAKMSGCIIYYKQHGKLYQQLTRAYFYFNNN